MTPWQENVLLPARQIDQQIAAEIDRVGLTQADTADWRTICRRISLGLVGNSLSLEELRAIEQIDSEHRVEWWTDYLLADSRWSHYFSERFSRAFVGTNEGPFLLFRRRIFQLWIADEFRKGTPYDQIVQRMLAAEGLWTDKPEVNFLTSTIKNGSDGRVDEAVAAGRTSRAFLGMRIDCMQCHDDVLGNVSLGEPGAPKTGTQLDFHQLAAYFSGARVAGPNALAGLRDESHSYQVQLLGDEDETEVKPSVPYSKSLDIRKDGSREALAAWVTSPENKAFSRATVNRVWALLFGKPLIDPVDDIPLNGPFPPALETLADAFAASHFNLRDLVKTIVSTHTFRRDSRLEELPVTAEHESTWATFPLTQLRPDQVAASLNQACRLQMIDDDSSIFSQLERSFTRNDFTKEYGDRGEDEFKAQNVTVPQRLIVMNGKYLRDRIDDNPIANASSQIGFLAIDDEHAVVAAYLATLNRLPTETERTAMVDELAGLRRSARSKGVGDLFWILLNSTEFLWNH